MREGQQVYWANLEGSYGEPSHGDQGTLLASTGTGAHVLWSTGARAGATDLVSVDDLAPLQARASKDPLADSLDFGGLTTFAAREVYDEGGEAGVVNHMAGLGHLSAFEQIAEEAMAMVASRIRHDPSFRDVVAQLEDEEGEAVVRLASACLIRDAFGGDA